MKEGIHPEYRSVVFEDVSNGTQFLTRSCVNTSETTMYNGEELPCLKVEISSASHPFYTGSQKFVDTEGRIERFRKRYEK